MCKINKPIIDTAATAANIKALRIRAGYSVKQIQSIFNFSSPQAVYNWEAGRDVPVIDNIIVLASVYGVKMDDIIKTKIIEMECDTEVILKSA